MSLTWEPGALAIHSLSGMLVMVIGVGADGWVEIRLRNMVRHWVRVEELQPAGPDHPEVRRLREIQGC